jgi:rubrerythrin
MGTGRTVGQVLRMAIDREAQAVQFYMDLTRRAEDPAMKDLYSRLAEEEFKHKCRLEMEMLKQGLVVRNLGQLDEVDDAYADDLALSADADYRELVQMGVKKERRAFRLYVRLAGVVPDRDTREVLLQLAGEEARHMVQFETEFSRLTANE